MSVKNWIIEKLGGYTRDHTLQDVDNAYRLSELFVLRCYKENKIPIFMDTQVHLIKDLEDKDLVVVQSDTFLANFKCRTLEIAPWCVNVELWGVETVYRGRVKCNN